MGDDDAGEVAREAALHIWDDHVDDSVANTLQKLHFLVTRMTKRRKIIVQCD